MVPWYFKLYFVAPLSSAVLFVLSFIVPGTAIFEAFAWSLLVTFVLGTVLFWIGVWRL